MGKRTVLFASAAVVAAGIGIGGIATANGRDARFNIKINGANEVPAADADGRGEARLVVDLDDNEVCLDVRFDRTGTPNRGHIHRGNAGVNGPIVVAFFDIQLPEAAGNPLHDVLEKDRAKDLCQTATHELLTEIVQFPERFYVNLHNARYPGGAIRGQVG
jgi:hypothetical protein